MSVPNDVGPVAILCGGYGTRLSEHTRSVPKPLVEIGGKPILWHVIQIYAAQGLTRFVLCVGYLGTAIEEYVDRAEWPAGVEVECVRTGEHMPTGGRLHQIRDRLAGGTSCVTYADGVADIDLGALIAHHREHGRLATVTVVQPELPWGVAELNGDGRVQRFVEKPPADRWINGGFFCLEPGALEYLDPDTMLEREPLGRLAADGQLQAYRHTGFWACMDTYKDAVRLGRLWEAGDAPWRVWA